MYGVISFLCGEINSGKLPDIFRVLEVLEKSLQEVNLDITDIGFDFSGFIHGSQFRLCGFDIFSLRVLDACSCENINRFPIPDVAVKLSNDRYAIIEAKSRRVNKARKQFSKLKKLFRKCKGLNLDDMSIYIIILEGKPKGDYVYCVRESGVRKKLIEYISSKLNLSQDAADKFIRDFENEFGINNIYVRIDKYLIVKL